MFLKMDSSGITGTAEEEEEDIICLEGQKDALSTLKNSSNFKGMSFEVHDNAPAKSERLLVFGVSKRVSILLHLSWIFCSFKLFILLVPMDCSLSS